MHAAPKGKPGNVQNKFQRGEGMRDNISHAKPEMKQYSAARPTPLMTPLPEKDVIRRNVSCFSITFRKVSNDADPVYVLESEE